MMQSQTHDMGQLMNAIGGASKLQDMELHGDKARLLRAQAGLAENELTQEEAFARGMSQMGSQEGAPMGPPDPNAKPASRAAPLYQMANIALRAGAVKKGQDLLSKASTIEHQENQDRMGDQKLKYYQRKDAQEHLERLGGFYSGVKSQDELDAANAAYKQIYPDAPLPQWALTPYSPTLMKGFQDSLLDANHRLSREQKDEAQEARDERLEFDREREERIARQARVEAERKRVKDAAVGKAGGGKVSTTVGKDLPMLAAREIGDAIFNGETPPEFRKEVEGAKIVIAARAKQLVEQNRGLSLDQAVARAVQESRESGEWTDTEVERPTTTMGIRTGTDKIAGKKFKARATASGVRGTDWGSDLPPEKIKELANAWSSYKPAPANRQFSDGTVYETPRGRLMRSGGKWFTQEEWARR